MILRRLSQHVRDQNWFAVALDFLIVVVGVFIGLQVSNWDAGRQRQADARAALERLQNESEFAVAYFQRFVDIYDSQNNYRSEALRLLTEDEWESVDREQAGFGMTSISLLPSAEPPDSAYQEFITSGLFSEISPVTLRDVIGDYQSELRFLRGQIDYFRRSSHELWRFDGIDLEYTPDTSRQRRYVIDFESLRGDQEFLDQILAGNNRMRAISGWWRDTRDAAMTMCEEISLALETECDPPYGVYDP